MVIEILNGRRYGKTVLCKCDYCNKVFNRPFADIKKAHKQFCSKSCHQLFQKMDKIIKQTELQYCACGCGELIPKYGAQLKRVKYKVGHQRKGNLSNFWKGGKSKLSRGTSPERTRWKKNVLKRDNYTCHICRKRGGKFHIHHIYPYNLYPHFNYEVWNGLTLCPKCHHKVEGVLRSLGFLIKRAA